MTSPFRSQFSLDIFNQKYRHDGCETWDDLADTLVADVCARYMTLGDMTQLAQYIAEMKFIPGGRYLYYAGRPNPFFNNCYLLRSEEDTREDWADLSWKAESCLMTGGGIGNDYSRYRGAGSPIARTGGVASGPLPKMEMINEIGRRVMQGGSRRSAIYASLIWSHPDARDFLVIKDWDRYPVPGTDLTLADLKNKDFNWPCPLDMTNISLNYDDAWLASFQQTGQVGDIFLTNVRQALKTAEPGFSFNFGAKSNETLRNAPVAADTKVLTSDGYVQVSEIVNREVSVWTGKQWAPARFVKTKSGVPTVRVSMSGGREIVADPEHEFFVERWSGKGEKKAVEIVKVPAGQLQPDDRLHVSLPQAERSAFDAQAYKRGFIFGDGHNIGSKIDLAICHESKKVCFDRIADQFDTINWCDSRGYIRAYGYDGFFDGQTKDKLPFVAHSARASFLAGLFDADGSYDADRGTIRLSSVNLNVLNSVRRLLEELGIQAYISSPVTSGFGGNKAFNLVVASSSTTEFARLIPTVRLQVEAYEAYRHYVVRVVSVVPDVNQDVFCCDVGVEEHSFCAEGVIISNCTEVTSEDDSDVCNLGSLNLGRIETIDELRDVIRLATMFLICGTLRAKLPYGKVYDVREKNRRLGLGLMGVHEWLIKRGYRYEVVPELHNWLGVYRDCSDRVSAEFADALSISRPVANRAIAPTGTIGIMAGTTTGIEPLFAVAYKRRYLKSGTDWHYQFVVDGTAKEMIQNYGADPDNIESAIDLATDYERRIAFQADIQDYVDMAISSTINLPEWGSEHNNEDTVAGFADTLARFAPRLRGFTAYPNGARGGQPLTPVSYQEAILHEGQEFAEEHVDICDLRGGGICGS
jgi:ribonucleotide reductase alpha subunit